MAKIYLIKGPRPNTKNLNLIPQLKTGPKIWTVTSPEKARRQMDGHVARKLQVKATVRRLGTAVGTVESRTLTTPSAGADVEQQDLPSTICGSARWHCPFG